MKKLFYLLPILFFILSCEKEEPEAEAEKETTIEFSQACGYAPNDWYIVVDVYLYGYNANDEKIFEHPLKICARNKVYSIPTPTDVKKVKVYCAIEHLGKDNDSSDDWTEKFWVDYITYLIPNKANTISIDKNTFKSESEPE